MGCQESIQVKNFSKNNSTAISSFEFVDFILVDRDIDLIPRVILIGEIHISQMFLLPSPRFWNIDTLHSTAKFTSYRYMHMIYGSLPNSIVTNINSPVRTVQSGTFYRSIDISPQLPLLLILHDGSLSFHRVPFPAGIDSGYSCCSESENSKDEYSPFERMLSGPIGFPLAVNGIFLLMFVEEAFLKLFLGVPLIIGAWFLIFLQDDSPPYPTTSQSPAPYNPPPE